MVSEMKRTKSNSEAREIALKNALFIVDEHLLSPQAFTEMTWTGTCQAPLKKCHKFMVFTNLINWCLELLHQYDPTVPLQFVQLFFRMNVCKVAKQRIKAAQKPKVRSRGARRFSKKIRLPATADQSEAEPSNDQERDGEINVSVTAANAIIASSTPATNAIVSSTPATNAIASVSNAGDDKAAPSVGDDIGDDNNYRAHGNVDHDGDGSSQSESDDDDLHIDNINYRKNGKNGYSSSENTSDSDSGGSSDDTNNDENADSGPQLINEVTTNSQKNYVALPAKMKRSLPLKSRRLIVKKSRFADQHVD